MCGERASERGNVRPIEPPSNLTSPRARLRNHARDLHQIESRVQRRLPTLVVNEMFLTVDPGDDGPPVLVKGGTAIDLRRGSSPARLSKDRDAAVRGDLDHFIANARTALANGWSGSTGRLAREAEIDVHGLADKPRRLEIKPDYRGKPFATVPIELSPAEGRLGRRTRQHHANGVQRDRTRTSRTGLMPVAALPDRTEDPRLHRPA